MSSNQELAVRESTEIGLPSPEQMQALKSFCADIQGTPFLPKALVREVSPDKQAATLLSVVLTGREMGLSPMQALRSFFVSPDGRLGMYADAMTAVMFNHGAAFVWKSNTNECAELYGKREGREYTAKWTIEDAVTAQLANKDIWRKYPRNMLRARCKGEMFRELCPDLGGAQMYTKEEMDDMGDAPTAREQAHAEADAVAQEDPAYNIAIVGPSPAPEAPVAPAAAPEPAPAPAPAPPPPEPVKPKPPSASAAEKEEYKRLAAQAVKLVQGAAVSHVKAWLKGWFQNDTAPATPAQYNDALKVLIQTLTDYPSSGATFLADAVKMGDQMRSLRDMPESEEPPEGKERGLFDPNPEIDEVDEQISEACNWDLNIATLMRETVQHRMSVPKEAVLKNLKALGVDKLNNDNAFAYAMLYHHSADGPLLCREMADAMPADILDIIANDAKLGKITVDSPSDKVEAAMLALLRGQK